MAETPLQNFILFLASLLPDGSGLVQYQGVAFLPDDPGDWIFWDAEALGANGQMLTTFQTIGFPQQPPRDPEASVYLLSLDGTVGEDFDLEQALDLDPLTWSPAGFPQFAWQPLPNVP